MLLSLNGVAFQLMCSYVFMPVTYLMGVEWTYCFKVGDRQYLNQVVEISVFFCHSFWYRRVHFNVEDDSKQVIAKPLLQ